MIPPRRQWCANIDVTNACPRRCSNCTRMTAHVRTPYYMTLEEYERALQALAAFPYESERNPNAGDPPGGPKRVGMMGGEPLSHPQFPELCHLLCRYVPERVHRAIFTAADLSRHPFGQLARQVFGYVNNPDPGHGHSHHQPVLVAVGEVIRDEGQRRSLIESCPLQEQWSSTITPKGFFACELHGVFDWIFEGPGGLPVEPACWRHDLDAYREQIQRWCPRCGVCLPLQPRQDTDRRDDISPANLEALRGLGSPRVLAGDYVLYDTERWQPPEHWSPLRYMRSKS